MAGLAPAVNQEAPVPDSPGVVIPNEERGLAALTHLSGLSGYVIPFGGVLVPIIIWMVKKDSPVVSAVARQAILLNVIIFVLLGFSFLLWLTLVLIPLMILVGCALFVAAIALPIMGAIKANRGMYYRYPVVGSNP
jgi:uncharacterized Tic20 family protein